MVNPARRAILLRLPGLISGVILERTGLFTIKALINNEETIVYLNNTGRLLGVIQGGKRCYCTTNSPSARIKYRVVGVEDNEVASIVDTSIQERAFLKAVEKGLIPWLLNCELYKKSFRLGPSIIDYVFKCSGELVLVELKSAVMRLHGEYASYPDAPTPRGRLQIKTLGEHAERGEKAIVVFIAGIPGAKGFKLYCGEDKYMGEYVKQARLRGVVFKSIGLYLDPIEEAVILYDHDLPVYLDCT